MKRNPSAAGVRHALSRPQLNVHLSVETFLAPINVSRQGQHMLAPLYDFSQNWGTSTNSPVQFSNIEVQEKHSAVPEYRQNRHTFATFHGELANNSLTN
jgi:hypothetical protein